MRSRRLLAAVSILLAASHVTADEALIREVRHEFAGMLPAMDRVVPGYERPTTKAPSLAVGDFLPADRSVRSWSFAIGRTLRRRINYVPTVKLKMPHPTFTGIDTGVETDPEATLLPTLAHFRGLRDTLGIETVLTGELRQDGDYFVIDAALVDSGTGEARAEKTWRATPESVPAAIVGISIWTYDELGVALSPDERTYVEDPTTLRPEALIAFVENLDDLSYSDAAARQALAAELRTKHPHFVPFVTYEMYARNYPTNLAEVREQLEGAQQARRDFPGHAGVASSSYAHSPFRSLGAAQKRSHVEALRALVLENPQDPMMPVELAVTFGKDGDYLSALTVILEATERWPDYYRTWWVLGDLLNERSWQVRGNTRWAEVPREAQERFMLLSFVADRVMDKAIAMHGRNGMLWHSKVKGIGSREGFSERLMAAFEEGVQVAPTYEPLYASTLNYAQNKWGGNAAARRRIITLAEENNPDAAWPRFLRSYHEADFAGLEGIAEALTDEFKTRRILENPLFWQALFAVIAGIVALSVFVSMRRVRRSSDGADNDYRHRRGGGRHAKRELTLEEKLREVQRQRR